MSSASPRFGYAEVSGHLVRTWDGYLLWLSASESSLVKQLLVASPAERSTPTSEWLSTDHPDYRQRLLDLPGLVARGVVQLVGEGDGQRIALRLPQDFDTDMPSRGHTSKPMPPSVASADAACDGCAVLAERVVQADVISAMMRARGGQWLLRLDAPLPACDHGTQGSADTTARPPASESVVDNGAIHPYSTSWRGGSAQATRKSLLQLVDVDFGIISGIRRGSGLPAAIPVWFAGPNRALSTADPSGLTWRWPGNSMGKGLTDEEAQLSALAEAAERWSGTWQRSDGTEPVRGRDLVTGAEVLTDADVVYMGHPPVAGVVRHTDTNGLAAGVTLVDAQLQALLEVIEREALAAWWERETRSQSAALAGQLRSELEPFLDWLGWLGLRVELRRLPSLGGTQTHLAVGWLPGSGRWLYGAGTHIDHGIATRRAVLELVQSAVAALATPKEIAPSRGIRTDLYPEPQSRPSAPERAAPDEVVSPAEVPPSGSTLAGALPGDVASAVRGVVQALAGAGHLTITVDVTRPEVGVPVARVIVDGLRGMPLPMR